MKHFLLLTLCLLLAGCGIGPAVLTPASIPPELSIEEHALTRPPEAEYAQLYFAGSTEQAILARHADERAKVISFMERSCTLGNHFGQCTTLGSDQMAAWEDYTSGIFHSGSVTVTRNDSRIYRIPVGTSCPIEALRGLWTYADHWALETAFVTSHQTGNMIDCQARGQISLDGKLLNTQLGFQEAFGFQIMHEQPFYFYKQHNQIGIVYKDVTIPLGYSEIPHYGCCSAATLNPRASQNMVAFFASKGSTWYYVEIGVFK